MCETISIIASQDISDHKIVSLDVNAKAILANALDISQVGKILGISINSAKKNKTSVIQINGLIDGFQGLIPGAYFIGINGNLSNTVPPNGFIQRIGIAIDSKNFIIRIGDPIIEMI